MLGFDAISAAPISGKVVHDMFPVSIVSLESFGLDIVSLVFVVSDIWIVRFR